ncbi:MAG: NADAR family protein [Sphingobacteriales bacterium]|nr:MAG: NADAR family protein [Sphingobacteriales bacterium]
MTYNLNWLLETIRTDTAVDYLLFWGHQKSKDGTITVSCFSQWWPSPFTVEGVVYQTAEHWMMAQKALLFKDQVSYQKIVEAGSPKEAKALGRGVQNYEDALWTEKRFEIVVAGNMHKFSQDDGLAAFLHSTGTKVLVEASPVDPIWGIGLSADSPKAQDPTQWNGLNLLGFALMAVRDRLENR